MSKEDVLLFTCYGKRGNGKSYMEHLKAKDQEIERLNNIIENLTTMTVNGDRTQIKNTAQYKIDRAIEYHDNCINNLLDLDKIDENERLAYKVAYEIHDNYLKILKGVDKE